MNINGTQPEIDIKSPTLTKAFLEFYLFETWEKILQISTFVNSREQRRSRKNWPVISHFSDVLEYLTMQLDKFAVPCLLEQSEGKGFTFDSFIQAIVSINDVLEALFKLHGQLHLLSGKAESQVAYNFVRKLEVDGIGNFTQRTPWISHVSSIALTDSYGFIEFDLGEFLSKQLTALDLHSFRPKGSEIVLTLPKVEADNPLMWGILVHEIAYSIVNYYRILEEVIAHTPRYFDLEHSDRDILRRLTLKACADLTALRLLGPSYLFSFASMSILKEPPNISAKQSDNIDRISKMVHIIKAHYPQWIIKYTGPNKSGAEEDPAALILNLARYKNELWSHPNYHAVLRSKTVSSRQPNALPDVEVIFDVLDRARVPTSKSSIPRIAFCNAVPTLVVVSRTSFQWLLSGI
jgi:hypothetical protein